MSKADFPLSQAEMDELFSPAAIRAKARQMFSRAKLGLGAFEYHEDKLAPTVSYVLKVIRANYPDLKVPFHSRWRHFNAGGVDRGLQLKRMLEGHDHLDRARAKLDLAITSVLLDAGAGAEWSYREQSTGQVFNRSEGLGVASFHMFCAGTFGGDFASPKAEGERLRTLKVADLETNFQVGPNNPLIGVDGRVKLLNSLATALENKKMFRHGRPGNIIDYLLLRYGSRVPASGILRAVIDGFGSIWPGRLVSGQVNLGDVWVHPDLGKRGFVETLVPIHKLSQWMTYSLIEPIQDAGYEVTGVEELTGLAEYRNGGLMLDSGLLTLRDPNDAGKEWSADSTFIVEWRALTIHLLDLIGAAVQKELGKAPKHFPLAKVLEGGTWWAGRMMAKEKRAEGSPPLNIVSDGTVF